MIQGHEKFNVVDIFDKPTGLYIEVNWKEDDKKTNECKVLKLTFPDGKEAFMKREHLLSVLFAISKEEDQRKMIPQTVKKVRWYETVVSVKAKKDIHKGENITFPIKLTLPAEKTERIGSLPAQKSSKIFTA